MRAPVRFVITFNKFDLIPPENILVQKNGIMCIKDQLSFVFIDFIIMINTDYIHQNKRMQRNVKLIDNQRRTYTAPIFKSSKK